MPSQQSSFSGTRTASASQPAMASAEAAVIGTDEYVQPSSQAYSVPGTFTPRRRIAFPAPLTKWLPSTATDSAGPAAAGPAATTTARPAPTISAVAMAAAA